MKIMAKSIETLSQNNVVRWKNGKKWELLFILTIFSLCSKLKILESK